MHLMMLTDCFTLLIVNREHDALCTIITFGDRPVIVPHVVSDAYSNLFEELSILSFHYHLDFIIVTHIACSYNLRHYIRCLMRLWRCSSRKRTKVLENNRKT